MNASTDQGETPTWLARLKAQTEISELVLRYAHSVSARDYGGFANLFTDDAIFEVRERSTATGGALVVRTRIDGGANFRAFLAATLSGDRRIHPLIHNLVVTPDGALATSKCKMIGADNGGRAQFFGGYEDAYRREDGWRFTARVFTITG